MRWLRTLLMGALAIVGGVLGNLLAAGMGDSWGQVLALGRVVGTVSGVGLVLVEPERLVCFVGRLDAKDVTAQRM